MPISSHVETIVLRNGVHLSTEIFSRAMFVPFHDIIGSPYCIRCTDETDFQLVSLYGSYSYHSEPALQQARHYQQNHSFHVLSTSIGRYSTLCRFACTYVKPFFRNQGSSKFNVGSRYSNAENSCDRLLSNSVKLDYYSGLIIMFSALSSLITFC